ncbi:preprotein translocase subunit SecD [Bradyrhizobium guangzhouense]|uniref:Preprotein translocase subunit SecD n=1 Tax=Bradyrhizobium guangzhouense TaxID=1325095 RepID=A0ABY0ECB1_9BRAD|nr:preprotein translocase subunit SecD [Bradyrhizobium guangzhouense]RXH15420.1 preprotein translocase subunit SecD [Bradyrhizobium guangzhouense]
MTRALRKRTGRLAVMVSVAIAIALPCAALAEGQFDKIRAKIAAFVGDKMEKLGGSRIIYKVDSDGLRESVVTDLRDDVYKILHDGHIAFSDLAIRDGGVDVKIADAKGRDLLARKLAAAAEGVPSRAVSVTDGGDNAVRLAPTDAASKARLAELVGDSIAMIEQRLKDADFKLVSAVPDGPDRIRIFLPGVTDPERITTIFARRVKISLRQVDVSMLPELAQSGKPPEGTEVLLGFKDKRPYLVAKESALDGEDVSNAAPSFAPGTKDPVVSFRFNGRGTRRFAHLTEENIGKPIAIALDDTVISAPVIREPITGGSVQISGNFTLEEANSVAMQLRAGSLPGHLTLVEQQVIQPGVKP